MNIIYAVILYITITHFYFVPAYYSIHNIYNYYMTSTAVDPMPISKFYYIRQI